MKPPRGLSADEAALWRKVTATVTPLDRPRIGEGVGRHAGEGARSASPPSPQPRSMPAAPHPPRLPAAGPPPPLGEARKGLDASWERKLGRGTEPPDFTLDLHGLSLDAAHSRLDAGLTQARAMGARLVVVVAGKPRPVEAADRGERRGAIRAKILDWLAAGPHADAIAAIRKAHRRHGGEGALYLVLRRER